MPYGRVEVQINTPEGMQQVELELRTTGAFGHGFLSDGEGDRWSRLLAVLALELIDIKEEAEVNGGG